MNAARSRSLVSHGAETPTQVFLTPGSFWPLLRSWKGETVRRSVEYEKRKGDEGATGEGPSQSVALLTSWGSLSKGFELRNAVQTSWPFWDSAFPPLKWGQQHPLLSVVMIIKVNYVQRACLVMAAQPTLVLCAPLHSPCTQDDIKSNGKTLLIVTHSTFSESSLPSVPPAIVGADCPRHATLVTELSPLEKISSLLPIFRLGNCTNVE